MPAIASNMMKLGTVAPAFDLPDVSSEDRVSLETFEGRPLLVMFICRHCPYVQAIRDELARLGRDYIPRGAALVGISSNDATAYPDDAPDSLAEFARDSGFNFPLCHDESQAVARAYGAACTPDFFLFDVNRRLAYRGRLDGSRPGNQLPTDGGDIRAALDALLDGRRPAGDQKPSLGCSIKWKA